MEDGRINNGQITVSSYYSWGSNRFDGGQARLNNMKYPGAWEPTDSNPWIQVDFLDQKTVGAIATQGWGRTGNIRENSHVKTFKLSWSVDGIVWINYKEDGIEKVSYLNQIHVSSQFNTYNQTGLFWPSATKEIFGRGGGGRF